MELFYDTCALLNLGLRAFETPFIISQQTLLEIEDIKSIISTICSLGSNPDNSQDNLMPGSFRITYRH